MKLKFKVNKRVNLYITLFACAVSIWLMVQRFGLTWEEVWHFLMITLVIIGAIILITLPFSLLVRWLNSRNDEE